MTRFTLFAYAATKEAESPAEARFANPKQNCYTTANGQESIVSTGLRIEVGVMHTAKPYWKTETGGNEQ